MGHRTRSVRIRTLVPKFDVEVVRVSYSHHLFRVEAKSVMAARDKAMEEGANYGSWSEKSSNYEVEGIKEVKE